MTARMSPRAHARRLAAATLLALVAALAATAAPATAAGEPAQCYDTAATARPGLEREYLVQCLNATAVEVARPPAHGSFTVVELSQWGLRFRYRPDDDGTTVDDLELRVTGATGTATIPVSLDVIPRSQNTPPTCSDASYKQRSSGTEPVTFRIGGIGCYDAEDDPLTIAGGGPGTHWNVTDHHVLWNEFGWHYRTSATSGTERTPVWAVDALGARSADAILEFEFGPAVDTPPSCVRPPSGGPHADVTPIRTRGGRPLRFILSCTDSDADPFEVGIADAPAHGTLQIERRETLPYSGGRQEITFLYTPSGSGTDDPFTVGLGDADEQRFALDVVDPDASGSLFCEGGGESWANPTSEGDTVDVGTRCVSELGDPIVARIVEQTPWASITPPIVEPNGHGVEHVHSTFTDTGVLGLVRVKLEATIVGGLSSYSWNWAIATGMSRGLQDQPLQSRPAPVPGAPGAAPSAGQQPRAVVAVTPAQAKRAAQRILKTQDVTVVKRLQDATVYAGRAAWKRGLPANGTTPALVVACVRECTVESAARLELATGKARSSAVRSLARQRGVARADQPLGLRLGLTRADRARVKRARAAHASFALTVTSAKAPAVKATVRAIVRR